MRRLQVKKWGSKKLENSFNAAYSKYTGGRRDRIMKDDNKFDKPTRGTLFLLANEARM